MRADSPAAGPVLCVLGPTASGKTGLAVELREQFGFELVSVDSALVYKRMDIGTAKPDAATLRRAPHALIDLIEPWEAYSVSRFLHDANSEIQRVHAAGGVPLLVGGTMMYFHALWHGLSELPPSEPAIRLQLERELTEAGLSAMYSRLQQTDPQSASRIDPNDPQRILRALEVFEVSGKPMSQLQNQRARNTEGEYDFHSIGLFPQDRAQLHANIKQRFDLMLEEGFIEEVRNLLNEPNMHMELPSMRCVGYRQACGYLQGQYSLDELSEKAVAATRQLAKRQLTWMRKMNNVACLDIPVSVTNLITDKRFVQWRDKYSL